MNSPFGLGQHGPLSSSTCYTLYYHNKSQNAKSVDDVEDHEPVEWLLVLSTSIVLSVNEFEGLAARSFMRSA